MRSLTPLLAAWLALGPFSSLFVGLPQANGQTATSQRAKSPAQLFQEGQTALSQGDLNKAESAFRGVLAMDPQSAAAYVNLGVVEMRRKHWDPAIVNLKKAEKLAPQMTGIRLNIGIVEYRSGNYPAAIEPLVSVVRDDPNSDQARYLLGLCYSFVEKYSDSVATLEPLWPRKNDDFVYLYVLGISAFHAGNHELDERALNRLVEVGGDKPEFHYLLGKGFLNRNEDAKALQEFQSVAAADPNLPLLHFSLGVAYHRLGKNDLAEQEFHKDIAMEPSVPYSYEQLGRLYVQSGRDDDAEKAFRSALKNDPRLPGSLLELARIYQRHNQNQKALEALDTALKFASDSQSIHFVRGQVLARLGRKAESQKELAIAQKLLDAGLSHDRAKLNDNPAPEVGQQP
jgi:tetratricopeptide (TPR) repeat protein